MIPAFAQDALWVVSAGKFLKVCLSGPQGMLGTHHSGVSKGITLSCYFPFPLCIFTASAKAMVGKVIDTLVEPRD